ncbi:MAG: hypothetical protein A6F71_00980 [Cycloclasticus sp. symbiont of Poecilosclerida sp. M]|nr:MAG: hypothetical protein A6F71_00980 [Cycloclasticus sp. symbiont of Poecilosclerida sp. M]
METIRKTPLSLGVAAGLGLLLASTGAMAISTGTDLNLSAKARAGGMAGAAYTMPQEASAAVFGNPATLTQFKGINMNFGASYLGLKSIDIETSSTIAALGGGVSTSSKSDADNYIVPDFGLTLQVSPNLVLGTGLEVDAGLGADYRDDPISLLGTGLVTIPLNVELISFNANLAAAYQATEKLSIGGAVTIGFALAQLGTTGPTGGGAGLTALLGSDAPTDLDGPGPLPAIGANLGINDFGGTTSSVHDIGFSGSLGATYEVQEGVMLSAAYKTKHEYNFTNILYQDTSLNGPSGNGAGLGSGAFGPDYQDLSVAQPAEVIVGVAFDNVIAQGLLVEADVVWKNWSDAATYENAYDDQFLFLLGAQYETGDWSFRAGYSYAEDILRSDPDTTLDSLVGLGTLPVGDGGPFGNDIVKIAQATLLPVIWNHTITAGVGYAITDAVSIDAYAAYAFGEEETVDLPKIQDAAVAYVVPVTELQLEAQVDYEFMVGAGINIALP